MLYNPAYGEVAGERHPRLLGMNVFEGWPEQKQVTAAIHASIRETGRPHVQKDVPFLYKRNGLLEEIYLNWSTLPLSGPFGGFYVALTDVTESRVAETRRMILRTMSQGWNIASDISSFWKSLTRGISFQPKEFPFALLYSANPESGTDHSYSALDARATSRFVLKSFIGNASARPSIQDFLNLKSEKEPFERALRQAVYSSSKDLNLLRVADGTVPDAWLRAAQGRGYADGTSDDLAAVVLLPIISNRTARTVGILIMGLNTRRPWNDAYQSWISEFGRDINESVTSILLIEEAARIQHENAKQAAREQVLLAKELAAREREASYANDKTMRLLKMMEQVDVGIFECSPSGTLLQANDAWYELSGHPRPAEMHTDFSFMDCVYPPDRELVANTWTRIAQGNAVRFEMRWKSKPSAPGQEPPVDGQWVLSSCFPVMDENGKLIAISGCTTNIGPQKNVVADALRRAEALERARASEREANRANERYQRMTQLIDEISVGVFEYDMEGRLVRTLSLLLVALLTAYRCKQM